MTPKDKVNHIKNWISDYVNSMPKKAQSLVIGISGGIDSSVSSKPVATPCVVHGLRHGST